MPIKITDDHRLYDKIISELKRLNNYKLIIMIDPSATYEDGTKVEDVGMWMEFGWDEFNVHYPSRPFWRSSFDSSVNKIQKRFESEISKILEGKTTSEQLLDNMGKYAVRRVKGVILKGTYEPLAESTIKAKGSSEPLKDTGKLLKSIMYKIEVR